MYLFKKISTMYFCVHTVLQNTIATIGIRVRLGTDLVVGVRDGSTV